MQSISFKQKRMSLKVTHIILVPLFSMSAGFVFLFFFFHLINEHHVEAELQAAAAVRLCGRVAEKLEPSQLLCG